MKDLKIDSFELILLFWFGLNIRERNAEEDYIARSNEIAVMSAEKYANILK